LNHQIVLSHKSKDIIRINSTFGKFNILIDPRKLMTAKTGPVPLSGSSLSTVGSLISQALKSFHLGIFTIELMRFFYAHPPTKQKNTPNYLLNPPTVIT